MAMSMLGRSNALNPMCCALAIVATLGVSGRLVAGVPDDWRKPAADTIAWFETSGEGYGMLATDFDCQGLSAGVLQWNVGKRSLWNELLKNVPEPTFEKYMPQYGQSFRLSLMAPAVDGLGYVRKFQKFRDASSCDGNVRNARWNGEGVAFSKELIALLKGDEVVALQRSALNSKLDHAWDYATWWAESKRGNGAIPTRMEFHVFADTLNFNGIWKEQANYQKVKDLRRNRTDEVVFSEILSYLAAAPDGQYQQYEARKNATLWKAQPLNDEKLDLLCFSYLIAKNITKPSAIPFRLNTISRRGAIIFNDGWVNRERVKFVIPSD